MHNLKRYESALLGECYYSTVHACGLPIYVFPKKMSSTYAMLAVQFGAVDNVRADGTRFSDGVAHFLEHKLFSNADGSDSFERFAAYGADANAYTAQSRTVYLFSCTERFEDSLAELLSFTTHPYFTPETVAKEQGIIAEEIRMCLDDPYDRCYRNMLTGLYENHPVRIDICGSERSVAGITADELYEVYDTYYTFPNMALVVCGDVTPEGVLAVADATLPHTRDIRKTLPVPDRFEPPHAYRARTVAHGQVAKPIFDIGIKDVHVPTAAADCTKRSAQMEILMDMLFSDTGELYNHLFDKGLISPEFPVSYSLSRDFGLLRISGEADEPQAVLCEIQAYLQRVAREGLSREEFEHCKRIRLAEHIKAFDSTEEIAENLVAFLFEGAEIFSYADVIAGVTFDEVCALFAEFFDPACFTLSEVHPIKNGGQYA